MLKLFFFLLFANLGTSLFVWELGFQCTTHGSRSQWSANTHQADVFFKNYTLYWSGIGNGCDSNPNGWAQGGMMMVNFPLQNCNWYDTWYPNMVNSGASVILEASYYGPYDILLSQPDLAKEPWASTVPPVYSCSNVDIYEDWDFNTVEIPNTYWAIWATAIYGPPGTNLTIFLDPPAANPLWQDWMNYGSRTQITFVLTIVVGILCLVVSMVKLLQFIHFSGLFKFQLPQVVCILSFLGGITIIYMSTCGLRVWRGNSNYLFWVFFNLWPLGFAFSVCTLMGLYFKDVSALSSRPQSEGTFQVFFWPAVIILAVTWILIIITGGLQTQPKFNAVSQQPLQLAMMAFIIIVLAVQLFLNVWGAGSMLFALQGVPNKGKILLVMGMAVFASILLCAWGVFFLVWIVYLNRASGISVVDIITLQEISGYFMPGVILLMILTNFQVQISKEVEVSKSGTSSTSSMSSGSSSSSGTSTSSSSGADPVIEL